MSLGTEMSKRGLHQQPQAASLTNQPRILRREWKRYKPHLQQSTSLPALQLIPPNRPIFQCRCGYTNTWVPLCLWCEWTSDEATIAFERTQSSIPRRSVSAPAGMVCRHFKSLDTPPETQTGPWVRTLARKHSFESVDSSLPPVTPRDDICHEPRAISHLSTVLAEDSEQFLSSLEDTKNRRCSKRYGFVAGFNNPNGCRPSSAISKPCGCYLKPQDKIDPTPTRGCTPTFTLTPESVKEASTDTAERSQPNIMELTFLVPSHSQRSVQSNIRNATSMHASSSFGQPQRTIRRKKRMTLLKQKSSRSLRTRASAPLLGSGGNDDSCGNQCEPLVPLQPTPQTLATVRLGHPSRPYYSAIRPNMSRPNTPANTSSLPPSRAASPSHAVICSNTFHPPNLALPSPAPRRSYPYPSTSSTIGFSMSGETELRMALARWRSLEYDEPTEYRFRNTENPPRGRGGRPNGRLGGKMRRLGMRLMELVLGRK